MKKSLIFKILTINLILIAVIFSMQVSVSAKLENEDEILERLQKENEDNPESVKYLVTDENISNILPKTSLESFKTNIENTIKLYENNTKEKEVTSGILKTGMLLEYTLNGRTYDISVLGDLNGDGTLSQIELTREIRHILDLEKWKIEGNIQILSGDITKDKKIDLDDTEAIINYIVFDKLDVTRYEKIAGPEITVITGNLKDGRYENNVEISIREKQEGAIKTIYKITGSAEREYKTIDKKDEVKIETDGIFKITAYTYGKDGNKSKASTNIIIREKPTYTVKYSAGEHGNFNTIEINKLYQGDETPKFTGEIVGDPGYRFTGWSEEISEKVKENVEYIAMWEPIEYNIEYELNGGKLAEGEENLSKYTVETESFTLKNPTKYGYKFLGWTENESEEIKENYTVEKGNYGDKKYIANWEALEGIKYTVKVNKIDINGEYKEEIIEYMGKTDEVISLDTTPPPGFTYDEERSTPTGTINPDGSTELEVYFKRNKYSLKAIAGYGINNISYKKLEEDAIVSETEVLDEIYFGTPITFTATENTGYTLIMWASNNKELLEDSENKIYEFSMPAGDIEITAISDLNEYEIEYDLNGGSLPEGKENPTTFTVENEDIVLNNPEKEGYTFEGWTLNDEEWVFSEYTIEKGTVGDIKLTATYTPNTDTLYKVIVHRMNTEGVYENETPIERHGTTGEEVSLTIENEEGFTFDTERSNISGIILPDGSLELNIYLSRNRYNLILNKETGIEFDNCASGVYYYGEAINLNTVIHEGYTWNEWRAGENTEFNSSQKERTIVMPAKDLTLTATVTVNIYHITYNLVGGAVSSTNITEYTVETETFRLNNPSKTGYVFTGWTGSNGSNAQKEISITRGSIGDKNYTANWTEADGTKYRIKVYKMDTNGNYGNPVSDTEHSGKTNAQISASTTVEKGFTYDSSRGKVSGTIAPDGSTVLEVYFSRNRYTLTLNRGIGISAVTGANTYYYEQEVTIDSTVTEGYVWNKWKTNTSLIPESTTKRHTIRIPAGNVTLTANATANTYAVTFNANGGTCSTSSTNVTFNSTYGTLPTASKTGYTFNGWFTAQNGGTQVYANTSVTTTSDHTLYAHWTLNNYTLTIRHYLENVDGTNYVFDEETTQSVAYGTNMTLSNYARNTSTREYNHASLTESGSSTTSYVMSSDTTIYFYYNRRSYTLTVAAGSNISSVTGTGTYKVGKRVPITATVASSGTGYLVTWSRWISNNTSLLDNNSTRNTTITMPAGNVTLTATATRTVEYYTVTCIDKVGNASGATLGTSSWTAAYGSVAYGSSATPTYSGYTYLSCTSATVTTSGATVYRYFAPPNAGTLHCSHGWTLFKSATNSDGIMDQTCYNEVYLHAGDVVNFRAELTGGGIVVCETSYDLQYDALQTSGSYTLRVTQDAYLTFAAGVRNE